MANLSKHTQIPVREFDPTRHTDPWFAGSRIRKIKFIGEDRYQITYRTRGRRDVLSGGEIIQCVSLDG